jgi:hypothetical protein
MKKINILIAEKYALNSDINPGAMPATNKIHNSNIIKKTLVSIRVKNTKNLFHSLSFKIVDLSFAK